MSVDAEKVKELREKTGLPMMECKKALVATGGDIQKAIDEMRKSGAKAQEMLAGRKATEGRIAGFRAPDGRTGVLVCLRCETEPVSKNQEFQDFLRTLVDVVRESHPVTRDALLAARIGSGRTVADGLTEIVNHMRENINIGGFAYLEGDAVGQYVHFDNKKAGMIALKGGAVSDPKIQELAKDLCMHVVFSRPSCLSKDKLDRDFVAKEREIIRAKVLNDPKNAKKPGEIVEKIIEGQFQKEVVASACLVEQPYYRDPQVSVERQIAQVRSGLSIVSFAYLNTEEDR